MVYNNIAAGFLERISHKMRIIKTRNEAILVAQILLACTSQVLLSLEPRVLGSKFIFACLYATLFFAIEFYIYCRSTNNEVPVKIKLHFTSAMVLIWALALSMQVHYILDRSTLFWVLCLIFNILIEALYIADWYRTRKTYKTPVTEEPTTEVEEQVSTTESADKKEVESAT